MLDSFRDAFKLPDLKRRILFTLGVLFIFRLGAHIPTPGIDTAAMARLFEQGAGVLVLIYLQVVRWRRFGIFALGVTPTLTRASFFSFL